MPDGLHHTIWRKDCNKLNVHDFHLRLKHQPDLSNIPSTPLEYCKEVRHGITKEKADQLAHPPVLSPIQQELMDWHHHLYHLFFQKILQPAKFRLFPKRLLDCKCRLPLCVACQFTTAHCWPWQVKGKASGSIRRPEHLQPSNGVSMDQIVSGPTWSDTTNVWIPHKLEDMGMYNVLQSCQWFCQCSFNAWLYCQQNPPCSKSIQEGSPAG